MSLQDLQKLIAGYDAKYFFPDRDHAFIVYHSLGHLNRSLAVLAKYADDLDHGRKPEPTELVEKAIPDLLQYALRLANNFNIDLEKAFLARQRAMEESKQAK